MGITFRFSALAFILVAAHSPAVGQQGSARRDISGTWKLDRAKSKLPTSVKIEWEALVIVSSNTKIEFRSRNNGGHWERTYIVDGAEHFLTEMASSPNHFRTYYTAEWQDRALITHYRTRMERSEQPTVGATEGDRFTERWTLSNDDRVLTHTSTRGAEVGPALVYDKQP